MRTIKFRGKSLETNDWVYGFLADGNLICTWDNRRNSHEVLSTTVGQFTGLRDKNGKEIYEGDIVKHPWKDPIFGDLVETGELVHSTICFNSGAFVVNYRLDGEYIYLQDFVRLKCLEVVDNIHDNPDIIEKGGEE
jgi:uncharacterized phage protein (TIGR01671 family)